MQHVSPGFSRGCELPGFFFPPANLLMKGAISCNAFRHYNRSNGSR
jgi:hypothetical protein